MIVYVDSLDFDNNSFLKSKFYCKARKGCWDSRVRGVGPPPIKTKDGWLLFYHAMDDNDPGKYKVGVMLLDYYNPHKVLNRSKQPVIEPDQEYENNGFKSGVVYACGAVVQDDTLYLYYGASDTTVALATASQEKFLYDLKTSHVVKLSTKPRQFLSLK